MKFNKSFFALVLVGVCCVNNSAFANEHKLSVVVTFSVLSDLVQQVGGDKIELTTLVGADGDSHVFRPRPKDTKNVANADVMFINGLEFEGWIERLIQSSNFAGLKAVVSNGSHLLDLNSEAHDDHGIDSEQAKESEQEQAEYENDESKHALYDPHAWHSIANVKQYINNIRHSLNQADPANSNYYNQHATDYLAELDSLSKELEVLVSDIPKEKRKVISSHDAFSYLEHDFGFEFIAPQSASTDSEASAADVAKIIRQMRSENIRAVFVENISNDRLMKQIANETNAKIGGVLYSDALSSVGGPAATYIDMMRHNVTTIVEALK